MQSRYFRSKDESSLEARFNEQQVQVTDVTNNCQQIARQRGPYILNADIGLCKYRAAKAKVGAGTLISNINFHGTSITAGTGATNSETKSFVARVRAYLASKFGDVGEGFVPIYASVGNARFTFTGTWEQTTGYGICLEGYRSIVSGSSFTFSFTGTGVDIITTKYVGGATASCVIDGGAPINMDTANATIIPSYAFSITGLSAGEHTMVVTKSADTKGLYISGCTPKNATAAGFRCNMMGKSSARTIEAAGTDALNCLVHNSPSLTVVEFLANDMAVSLSTYRTNIQKIITKAKLTGDVLLIAFAINGASASAEQEYIDILIDLANINSCAFVNVFERWGGVVGDPNSLTTDVLHPNDAGHYDIYDAIIQLL